MTDQVKASHPAAPYAFILAAAGGWMLSRYCGMLVWIPGFLAGLLGIVFVKTRLRPRGFAGAIAITSAHAISLVIASIISGIWVTAPDVVVMLAGCVWLGW